MDSNVRNAIATTVSTQGWKYIQQIAEHLIREQANVAIEEEDSTKGEQERQTARAQKRFFNSFMRDVQAAVEGEYDPDGGNFNEVVF